MSASPDDAMAQCQPEPSRSSLSSTSNGPQQQSTTTAEKVDDKKPIEKTISCVSCRKRKLKCDRVKPKCGTCTRLTHECEYPERRKNPSSKRRNLKELEARLAQVETQLVAETSKGSASVQISAVPITEPDWNNFTMDMNVEMGTGMLDESFNVPLTAFDYQPAPNAPPEGEFFSQELISLGLSEPLPPQQMIDDLQQTYFDKFHPILPMIHKYRYLAALNLPTHMQPPVCLRYALWATAASGSDKYSCYEDVLYERARKYIQDAEMKGHGETFVTIQFAQTWGLIANYEAKKTYFTRAWMSTGRMTRLAQMLGLHRLDGEGRDMKRILPPAKDWVELEERRRTFWAAFYGDRWASSGTGWPMIIDEDEIQTNLPCSEEAFYSGVTEETTTLREALTPEGASRISPFGGVVLSACLYGHNFQHLHKSGPDEHPEDLANGEFWKRHRRMDNVLSNTFMFLPDHLRLPQGIRDMNIVFLHMNIHASAICLHQAAILTAEKNNVSRSFIGQSRTRSLMAAEEIANIMRLVSHIDASNMNSWVGFCLYVAAGVFIQDQRSDDGSSQSLTNLEFVLAAMKAIGNRHSISNHFTAQLELDIESSGIKVGRMPNIPMNGILPAGGGAPMSVDDFQTFWERSSIDSTGNVQGQETCPYISNIARGNQFFGVIPETLRKSSKPEKVVHLPPEGLRDKHVHPSYPNWDPPASSALSNPDHNAQKKQQTQQTQPSRGISGFAKSHMRDDHVHPSIPSWDSPVLDGPPNLNENTKHTQQKQAPLETSGFAQSNPVATEPNVATTGSSPFEIDSFLAANTPSSDSSGSCTIQMPFRQGSSNHKSPDYSMFQASDGNSFLPASDWASDMPLNANQFEGIFSDPRHHHGPQATDTVRHLFDTERWKDATPPGG